MNNHEVVKVLHLHTQWRHLENQHQIIHCVRGFISASLPFLILGSLSNKTEVLILEKKHFLQRSQSLGDLQTTLRAEVYNITWFHSFSCYLSKLPTFRLLYVDSFHPLGIYKDVKEEP